MDAETRQGHRTIWKVYMALCAMLNESFAERPVHLPRIEALKS